LLWLIKFVSSEYVSDLNLLVRAFISKETIKNNMIRNEKNKIG